MNKINSLASLENSSTVSGSDNIRYIDRPRVLITDPPRSWRETVISRLNIICSLPRGWDGYRAGPVNFNTANFALRLMESICRANDPVPSIVPGSNGDLQIEWHLNSGDIEIHVKAPNEVIAWRMIQGQEDADEVFLTVDFTTVASWIKELLGGTGATIATAA